MRTRRLFSVLPFSAPRRLGLAGLATLAACGGPGRERPEPRPLISADAGALPPAPDAAVPTTSARVCSRGGWCWDGSGLHNAALFAVAGTADDLWAVGELGLALHFDGERWLARWAPGDDTLRAVAVDGDDVWAAGDAGLLHYVNGGWSPEAIEGLPADARLRGVALDSAGDLCVVGALGVLYERRAGVWSSVDVAAGAALNAVWSSGREMWAVGDAGLVLRRNADGWARLDAGTGQNLHTVHGRRGSVWVAGDNGELRRYDGTDEAWQRPAGEGLAPSGQLRALQVAADRVVVANELGRLYVWDETTTCPVPGDAGAPELPCPTWLETRSTPNELPISGLWSSGQNVLAVGALGSITSWQGDTRVSVSLGSLDNHLDVAGADGADVWIAGDRLLRWREGWQEVELDSPRAVYAVQPLGGRTLIAGTGGLARGLSDEAWQDMDVRADAWLRGLFSDGQTSWLVGSRGAAWGLLNGRLWTPLATPTDRDLLAVFGVPAGSVWAVGTGGVILRHDGSQWAAIPSGPGSGVDADLRGVWGSAEDDIWAVGTGGTTLHWDGRLWARVGEPQRFSLNAVWGRASDDVWAVGSSGTLLHYDGQAWSAEVSGVSQSLNAVWGNAERVWVVGERGTILTRTLD